jgi:hypothetical protein
MGLGGVVLVACGNHGRDVSRESEELVGIWRMSLPKAVSEAREYDSRLMTDESPRRPWAERLEELSKSRLLDFEVHFERNGPGAFRYMLVGQPLVEARWEWTRDGGILLLVDASSGISVPQVLLLGWKGRRVWMEVPGGIEIPLTHVPVR